MLFIEHFVKNLSLLAAVFCFHTSLEFGMDHIKEFYCQSSDECPHGNFHSIIALHETDVSWKVISARVPQLPRGWYELAQLNLKDRIEFTRDFWLAKLPYRPHLTEFIERFFGSLADVGIYITQKKFDDPYDVQLVYGLKDNRGFYHGSPPITDEQRRRLTESFSSYILPEDYLAFLSIHDGFSKATDSTGIIKSANVPESYRLLQQLIQSHDPMMTSQGNLVDPSTLIPFYESFGMPFFQCFWAEWYPEGEMGNVYYSLEAKAISEVFKDGPTADNMAFATFVDWLVFYLERIV